MFMLKSLFEKRFTVVEHVGDVIITDIYYVTKKEREEIIKSWKRAKHYEVFKDGMSVVV